MRRSEEKYLIDSAAVFRERQCLQIDGLMAIDAIAEISLKPLDSVKKIRERRRMINSLTFQLWKLLNQSKTLRKKV